MNKKYFLHFTWVVTLTMIVYALFCILDDISLVLPFCTYIASMIIYVLPMSYIKSKEAEIICLEYKKEIGIEQKIEQIILEKTERKLEIDNNGEKIFRKINIYSKWLTNDVVMKSDEQKIYLFVPNAYKKFFADI